MADFIVEKNEIENEVRRLSFIRKPALTDISNLRERVRGRFLSLTRSLREINSQNIANFRILDFLDGVLREMTRWVASLDDVDIIGDHRKREKAFFDHHDYLIQVNRNAHRLEEPNEPN